ncbi:MAG: DUF935 domain-containing protein, partial [Alphaproteobacteria bacterium]|nr:DUF935 domain-containing protein [Alphaproteobacteria bacterium]
AVVARTWQVEPASESPQDMAAADEVSRQVARLPLEEISLNLLDALLYGYAVSEIVWQLQNDTVTAVEVIARRPDRFVFDVDGNLRLLTGEDQRKGVALPDRKFIVHRFNPREGEPYGRGLGRQLYWPVYFKRQGLSYWMVFAEKFGAPTLIGRYPEGMSTEEQDQLLSAISSVAQETAMIAPLSAHVELLESARAGSVETYERLCRYLDEQMSIATLGETLTTTLGNVGARAATETHNEVRGELTDADADLLCETLNASLVRWIVAYNFPAGTGCPRLTRQRPSDRGANLAQKREQIALLRDLQQLGYRLSDARVAALLGEEVIGIPSPQLDSPVPPPSIP